MGKLLQAQDRLQLNRSPVGLVERHLYEVGMVGHANTGTNPDIVELARRLLRYGITHDDFRSVARGNTPSWSDEAFEAMWITTAAHAVRT